MKNSNLNIKYIRYVDDIRIFSQDKHTAKRAVAYLDLLARDLGLTPQASKIFIYEIYISYVLKKEFNILNGSSFFNAAIWNVSELYEELNMSFRFFFEYKI